MISPLFFLRSPRQVSFNRIKTFLLNPEVPESAMRNNVADDSVHGGPSKTPAKLLPPTAEDASTTLDVPPTPSADEIVSAPPPVSPDTNAKPTRTAAVYPQPADGVAAFIKGDFKWTNIPSVDKNPDGTIGNFRGIMASASKPIKTQFGYVVIFKRDTSTVAAV